MLRLNAYSAIGAINHAVFSGSTYWKDVSEQSANGVV